MIPILSIDATNRVDLFDRVQPPIYDFLQNERISHALHIAAGNHDEQNDTLCDPTRLFYAFTTHTHTFTSASHCLFLNHEQ